MARVASVLAKARPAPCRVSPLILMSDARLDIVAAAEKLPDGCAVIYRHFGADNREDIAAQLRQICFKKSHQFLIGADAGLALEVGADGVHFPQNDLEASLLWRARVPEWILTGACHDGPSLALAGRLPLDAVTLSPVFETQSAGSGAPLGLKLLTALAAKSTRPVIALGGINAVTAPYLIGSGAAGIAGVSGIALGA